MIKIENMKTLGQKIAFFRNKKGLSQAKLAEACGWNSQSRIGNYEKDAREPSLADLDNISKALGIERRLLLDDIDLGSFTDELSSNEHNNVKDIKFIPQLAKNFSYPLITWSDIEAFIDKRLSSNKLRGQGMSIKNEKEGFSLEVQGDSMATLGLNSFPAGTILSVDPNITAIEPDKFYIVKLPDGTITFKLLIRDAGLSYLKSLNDNYKPIPIKENECKFLGLIVDKDLGKLY